MHPESAAASLERELRPHPWFASVGIGQTSTGPALFVYVRTSRHRELRRYEDGWMGFPVYVRAVGVVRSLSSASRRVARSSEANSSQ